VADKHSTVSPASWQNAILLMAILAVAAILTYGNSLSAPFVFDDAHNIVENPHIRLTELSVDGIADAVTHQTRRPVASLTFALNYYFHGYDVAGYHVVNIAIHILTGFLMFLMVRRTLGLMHHEKQDMVAALAALVWIVNPVHTQSVTYIVQRMAALATLFFLLALYLYIKGRLRQKAGQPMAPLFFALCGLSGVLAVLSKQIAATLPVFILLYEWYFFQDVNGEWFKKRLRWIGAALAIIGIFAGIYLGASPMEKILAMYDTQDFTLGQRLLTEPRVIFLYLSLLFFPHPARLNLDYDFPVSVSLVDPFTTLAALLGLAGLLMAAAVTAKRYRLVSFAVLWFFGNLAIESSFLGLALVFEHRTYLPSVFVTAALVWAVFEYVRPRPLAVGMLLAVTVLFGFWTHQRNAVWADDVVLWRDVVKKSPNLARPWNNLGLALQRQGEVNQAIDIYNRSLLLDPAYVEAYNNLASALIEIGEFRQTIPLLEKALQINPVFRQTYNNIAFVYHQLGEPDLAIHYCRAALERFPDFTEAKNTLGVILLASRQTDAAVDCFRQVLAEEPTHLDALINLSLVFKKNGDLDQAADFLEKAVRFHPADAKARYYLGELYGMTGQNHAAILHLSEALRLDPGHAPAHNALGNVMLNQGNTQKAIAGYRKAIQNDPGFTAAHTNLAAALVQTGRISDAIDYLESVAASRPNDAALLARTAELHQQAGNTQKAIMLFEQSLRMDPACAACLNRLGMLYADQDRLAEAADAFEKLTVLAPDTPTIYYNLACLYARQNRVEPAVENLQKALDAGYDNLEHIRADPDLDAIRHTDLYRNRVETVD